MTTLPTASLLQSFLTHHDAFARFRRALRRQDQLALDDLLQSAGQFLPALNVSGLPHPDLAFFLAMLLEQHQELLLLRARLDELEAHGNAQQGC